MGFHSERGGKFLEGLREEGQDLTDLIGFLWLHRKADAFTGTCCLWINTSIILTLSLFVNRFLQLF